MRALVTGATGYLGFHLCRDLIDVGWEVHALVRPSSEAARVAALDPATTHKLADDLSNLAEIIASVAPDVVFNLAAAMPGRADHMALANQEFPDRLGAALAEMPDAVLVHAASWWEWDENGREKPANSYAETKADGRHKLEAAAADHGFRMASLVLHDTYGPADWRGKIVDHMLKAALHGREISLTPGGQMMDLVHVTDVAAAFRRAAKHMRSQPAGDVALYAVAGGAPVTLRALGEAVEAATGRALKADWGARPYRDDIPMRPGPMAPPLPSWEPSVSLSEGLRQLVAQHRQAAT